MLTGRRLFVVEDELLIAEVLTAMLEELGGTVVAQAGELSQGLALARHLAVELALVDVNLGFDSAWPVVDALQARGIAVLIMSGDDDATQIDGRRDLVLLRKPYSFDELRQAIAATLR